MSEQIIKNTDGHTYINVVQQTAVPTMKRFSTSSCEKRLLSRYRFTVKEIDPDGYVWSRIRVCPGTQQEFQKRQKQAGFTAK